MEIENWRKKIDAIDAELVGLLDQRAAIAIEIFSIKSRHGLPAADPAREAEIVDRLVKVDRGVIDDTAIARVYQVVLEESRRMQADSLLVPEK